MPRKFGYITGFITFIFISLIIFCIIRREIKQPQSQISCWLNNRSYFKGYSKIRDGDIILRHGYGLASEIISRKLHSTYDVTHCGIISIKKGSDPVVIHCLSNYMSNNGGIQSCPLYEFIKNSVPKSIIILRYKSQKSLDNSRISSRALYYLSKKIPYDNRLDLDDSSGFYCTELIYRTILDEFGERINKSDTRQKWVDFDVFFEKSQFEIVVNQYGDK